MLTKLKIALITGACLIGGVAAAQGRGGERHAKMLEKFDLNKDGKLDDAEKQAMRDEHLAKEFGRLDKNGDGQLSLDEFKALKTHHARMGKRGMRGPKP